MTPAPLCLKGLASPDLEAHWMKTLKQFGQEHQWSDLTLHQVQVVVEEWLENLLSHAKAPSCGLIATLRLEDHESTLHLTLTDNGSSFNPLAAPERSLDLDLDDLQPGGWGLHLMRKLPSSSHYERLEDHNQLVLTFKK